MKLSTEQEQAIKNIRTWYKTNCSDPYVLSGYAITCHKSQGSEFDSILVANEPVGKTKLDRQRWLYTAITRAKNKCYLVDGV